MFIEKADLIDKYIRRPCTKNPYGEFKETDPDLEDLSVVQFAKMFETTQKRDINETLDLQSLYIDKDDLKFHSIMRADKNKEEIVLPDYIKLLPKYPGENNFLRKR